MLSCDLFKNCNHQYSAVLPMRCDSNGALQRRVHGFSRLTYSDGLAYSVPLAAQRETMQYLAIHCGKKSQRIAAASKGRARDRTHQGIPHHADLRCCHRQDRCARSGCRGGDGVSGRNVSDTSERGLEALIERSLLDDAGYLRGSPGDYDRALCLDPVHLFAFLRATQPETLARLATRHGAQIEKAARAYRRPGGGARRGGCAAQGRQRRAEEIILYYPRPASDLNPQARNLRRQPLQRHPPAALQRERTPRPLTWPSSSTGCPWLPSS